MINERKFMPFIHEVGTDAVRLPKDAERRLSRYIGRHVHVRNTKDLANAYHDLMRAGIAEYIRKAIQRAEATPKPDHND